MILKFFRAFIVICAVSSLSPEAVQAKDDPNLTLGKAITLYDEAQELSREDRIRKLLQVNELLTEIETEHPENILTNFIKSGRAIGTIDVAALREELADIGAIQSVVPFGALPEGTKRAITSVAERACAASDCADEVTASLSDFILKVAFTSTDRAIDVEKLRWLFSNPGQLGGNLERVKVFEKMLDDPAVLAEIDARIAKSLLEKLGKEMATHFAIGLVTNVATEIVANWLEGQGKVQAAELARTWIEPSVDVGLALQGAATATSASAGTAVGVIWAKNAYAFVQLGQKTLEAEAAGATRDQQLAKIGSDIDSLHRSLITGKTSGPLFSEDLYVTVTPRMVEAFRDTLANQYEYQKYWLESEEAILLAAFEPIVGLAKIAAKTTNTVVASIPQGPGTQPSGTESANSTNALPDDIDLDHSTGTADQNVVLPADGSNDQVALFEQLPDGLYGTGADTCAIDSATVGDRWGAIFKTITKPEFSVGYEQECTIQDMNSIGVNLLIDAVCSAEGEMTIAQHMWRITGPEKFTDLNAYGGPRDYILCKEAVVPDTTPTGGRDWTSAIAVNQESWNDCQADFDVNCIRKLGGGDEAVRFFEEVLSQHEGGPVSPPVGFEELGKVDIVYIDTGTSQGTVSYFINADNVGISLPEYPERDLKKVAEFQSVARSLLSQFPDSFGWKMSVGGMRLLPNGYQRFSLLTHYTKDCRACRVIGTNIWSVDYDLNGKARTYQFQGILDQRNLPDIKSISVGILERNPELVQYFLNLRGYDAGPMDGAIGHRTQSAISEFQKENGINFGTGQPDVQTLVALVNKETLFTNGFEGVNTSAQQSIVSTKPRLGCSRPSRALTSQEVMSIFSNQVVTIVYEIEGALGTPTKKKYGPFLREHGFTTISGLQLGKWEPYTDQVRVSGGKLCLQNKQGEFCSAVSECLSNDALYILTPYGGTDEYVTAIGDTAVSQANAPQDADFTQNVKLAWGGNPQGIVGHFTVDGTVEANGLRLTLRSANGSYNPNARMNTVEPGTNINLLMSATPRKLCEDCKPEVSFTTAYGLRFENDVLSGPDENMSLFIPNVELKKNDVIALGLRGTNRVIYLTDVDLNIAAILRAQNNKQETAGHLPTVATEPTRISGIWEGITTAGSLTLDYRWQIEQLGEKASGIIQLKRKDSTAWSKYRFEGRFVDGTLRYRGTSWITPSNGSFCMASGTLSLSQTNDRLVLYGKWGGNSLPGGCPNSTSGGVSVTMVMDKAGASIPPRVTAEDLTIEDYYRLLEENGGDDYMTRLVGATRWKDTPEQRASLLLVVKAAISRDEEYTATRKASILLNVMHEASKLAGGDGELFRIMNYARRSKNGEHPSIGTVLESGSSWKEADDKAKVFHIIGYDNPDDVRKFTHPDGREAVFFRDPQSGQWEIMHDGTNDATYNLVNGSLTSPNDFYQHMLLDVVPWIVYGVSPDDKTSPKDRLETFNQSGPLAVATRLYPFFTKTGAELTSEVLEKLPSESQMTGPLRAWLSYKGQ